MTVKLSQIMKIAEMPADSSEGKVVEELVTNEVVVNYLKEELRKAAANFWTDDVNILTKGVVAFARSKIKRLLDHPSYGSVIRLLLASNPDAKIDMPDYLAKLIGVCDD